MEARRLILLSVILVAALAIAAYSLLPKGTPDSVAGGNGTWRVTITYPLNQTMMEGSGGIGLSSYALTLTLSFFSEGRLNESNIVVGPLGTVPRGNVTLVISFSNETSVRIFTRNSTIRVQGRNQKELFAATDRLILAVAGEYALGLDEGRNYLVIVHPERGHKVGLQWLGKLPIPSVRRVPIFLHGEGVNLRKMLLGPYSPSGPGGT